MSRPCAIRRCMCWPTLEAEGSTFGSAFARTGPACSKRPLEAGTAVEIDATPNRQDLNVELLELARLANVWVSIGTDSHSTAELAFIEFGLAAAIRAGIQRERILNFLSLEELLAWARR